MPKLPKAAAKRVDEAEVSQFDALEEGTYIGKLSKVTVSDQPGPSGAHYWTWEFEDIHTLDGDKVPGRLWVNTSLAETADWKMKEVFDAFGYTPDSDTDEMIGEKVKLVVSQRVIERGARKGQTGNNVENVMPLGDDAGEGDDTF